MVFQQAAHREPEIVTVTLRKPPKNGMGVSIVAAKVTASVWAKFLFGMRVYFEWEWHPEII